MLVENFKIIVMIEVRFSKLHVLKTGRLLRLVVTVILPYVCVRCSKRVNGRWVSNFGERAYRPVGLTSGVFLIQFPTSDTANIKCSEKNLTRAEQLRSSC